jgi:hypothetical protein
VHGIVALAVLKLALRLELGPEYDTNANRAEVVAGAQNSDQPTGSALIRTTARGTLAWSRGVSLLRLSVGGGAKVFLNPDVYDQTTFVGQLGADERLRVSDHVDLGLAGDYYDATQLDVRAPTCPGCLRHRDFRTGTVAPRITFVDDAGYLALSAGYRGFEWKPDANFNFQAAQARAVGSAHILGGRAGRENEWDLTGAYLLERRWFDGRADVNLCRDKIDYSCVLPGNDARADWFHEASLDASFLGPLLVALGYAVQLNLSNSFGFSLIRHIFTLKLGYRLPWQIYATAKAQLFVTSYFDPVLLAPPTVTVSTNNIEDENRNSLIVDLERPVGKLGLSVELRYSLYTNELSASPASFLRQVVYLGLSYRVSSR